MRLYLPDVAGFDRWLDENVADLYKAQPLAQNWARISKIGEEYGEAVQTFIGATGQNPRKGTTNSIEAVLDELADTLITCLLAMQHLTKDEDETRNALEGRWAYRLDRAIRNSASSSCRPWPV